MWTFSLFVVVIIAVLQMPSPSAGQTLHYTERLLKLYARVGQKLRFETYQDSVDMHSRVVSLRERTTDISTAAIADQTNAKNLLSPYTSKADAAARTLKIVPAMTVRVGPPSNVNNDDLLLSNVVLDLGLDFDGPTSSVIIRRPGVYFFEYKMQVNYQHSYYHHLDIYYANGVFSESLSFYSDWEVTPHFRMRVLAEGQLIKGRSYSGSNSWGTVASDVAPTSGFPRTHLVIRYMGKA